MDNLAWSPPIKKGEFYVLDGGFSSQLSLYMEGVDEDPLWTARSVITHPQIVEKVHQDFIQAGARIILTNTYQISEEGFRSELAIDSAGTKKAISSCVKLAKSAVLKSGKQPGYVLIGGSVGPFGACRHDGSEYTGAYLDMMGKDDLISWHLPRVKALVESQVDFIAAETLPCWREAIAILDTVVASGSCLPVWISFTIKDEEFLAGGQSIQDAIKAIRKHSLYTKGRIFCVGINCSAPKFISGAIDNIRVISKALPIVIYPNSGEVWDGKERKWDGTSEDWNDYVSDWIKKGVVGIGGCCRVDAKDIKELRIILASAYASIYC